MTLSLSTSVSVAPNSNNTELYALSRQCTSTKSKIQVRYIVQISLSQEEDLNALLTSLVYPNVVRQGDMYCPKALIQLGGLVNQSFAQWA